MARTVADAAAVLGALAGVDPARPGDRGERRQVSTDYTPVPRRRTACTGRASASRAQLLRLQRRRRTRVIEEALDAMHDAGRDAGRSGRHPAASATCSPIRPRSIVLLYEFKADLNAYLAELAPGAPMQYAGRRHRLQRGPRRPRRCRTSARSSSSSPRRRARSPSRSTWRRWREVPRGWRGRRASTR